MNKGLFLGLAILVILIVIISAVFHWKSNPTVEITPIPIITPSPSESDLIRVTFPQPHQTVTNSLTITGQARGTWYFEASFPIHLKDMTGTTIASTIASAQSDWMTTTFVPFEAQLHIPATFSGPATLVLSKDNPSGMPQNADSIEIPVTVSSQ